MDSVLLLTVFDFPTIRDKLSCKNIPKFTARPDASSLGRIDRAPYHAMQPSERWIFINRGVSTWPQGGQDEGIV